MSASTALPAALPAAAPPICHAGRRVSRDPVPAAAAGGTGRDLPLDHRLRELQVANEALVVMLDREKGNCRTAMERHLELERNMQEVGAPPAASSAPIYREGNRLYSLPAACMGTECPWAFLCRRGHPAHAVNRE